jgi:hypothetical protein
VNATALVRTYRPIKRNWQTRWEANFRFARQPPTIEAVCGDGSGHVPAVPSHTRDPSGLPQKYVPVETLEVPKF